MAEATLEERVATLEQLVAQLWCGREESRRGFSLHLDYYLGACIARTWAQSWWSRVFADTNCQWSDLTLRQ